MDFLLAQLAAVSCIGLWSALSTALILLFVSCFTRLRFTTAEEEAGADAVEHNIDYKSNDDTLLPLSITHVLSLGLVVEGDLNPTVFARRRLRRLALTMRRHYGYKTFTDEKSLRMIKAQQVKSLSVSWPKVPTTVFE